MESPTQVAVPPPKRKRRIRRTLCAIRDLIERLLTATAILVITVLFLVASWIYPPWVQRTWHGWYFIFNTDTGSARIDLPRLLLIDLIVAVPGALLAWTISRNAGARRLAARIIFYSIVVLVVAPTTVAVVWGGTVLIQNVERDVAQRAAETKHFDPATATLLEKPSSVYDKLLIYLNRKHSISVEIPGHGIAEFPGQMTYGEIAAVIKKKFFSDVISRDSLSKIVLNVTPATERYEVKATGEKFNKVYGLSGSIRNDLSRAVQTLRAKASFYNANGELIEGRTFWIRGVSTDRNDPNFGLETDTLSPGSTATFNEPLEMGYLPEGAVYRVDLIEAHCVPFDPDKYLEEKAAAGATKKNRELTDQEFLGNQAALPTPAAAERKPWERAPVVANPSGAQPVTPQPKPSPKAEQKSEYDVLLEPPPKQKE